MVTDPRVKSQHAWVLIPQRLARDPSVSGNAKLMYMAVRSHAPNSWPSINTLAGYMGWSRSTAKRALKEIEAKGWIEITHRHNSRGHRITSTYTLMSEPKGSPVNLQEGSPMNQELEPTQLEPLEGSS